MAYIVLLDADVLHPWVLCGLLLRLAERGLYRPAWSEEILDEVDASLIARMPEREERIRRRREAIQATFADALVPDPAPYLGVVPPGVEPGDRHVVAAALSARADAIVTRNIRDFAPDALAEMGLLVQLPDEFLTHQWWLDPGAVTGEVVAMAAETARPPLTAAEVLSSLEKFAPVFVATVRGSREFADATR